MSLSSGQTPDQTQNTYYCHICSRNSTNLTADYTCPLCHGGFVEIVEHDSTFPLYSTSDTENSAGPTEGVTTAPVDVSTFIRQVTPFFNYIVAPQQSQNTGASTSESAQPAPAGPQVQNFLQTLLQGLTNNGNVQIQFRINGDGGAPNAFAFPLPLHGNVGDYAWGPSGLDAIVTQLLNQVEGGAPPMQKDKIDQLPEIVITDEQVEKRIQCAVCMEDFKLAEKVCRIACEHLYHKECFVPWLQRHNSCPVCRKSAETGEPVPGSPPVRQPTFTLFGTRAAAGGAPSRNLNQSPQQQMTQSSNRSSNGDVQRTNGTPPRWMDIEELD